MTTATHPTSLCPSKTTSDILLDLFIQQTFGCIDLALSDCSDGITDITLEEETAPHFRKAHWDYFRAAA